MYKGVDCVTAEESKSTAHIGEIRLIVADCIWILKTVYNLVVVVQILIHLQHAKHEALENDTCVRITTSNGKQQASVHDIGTAE